MADLLVPAIVNTMRARQPATKIPRSSLLTPPPPNMTDAEFLERTMREVDHDGACLLELAEIMARVAGDDSQPAEARDEVRRAAAYLARLLKEDRYEVFSVIRCLRRDGLLPLSADTLAITGRRLAEKMDEIARTKCVN
ncbi:MAG: hypothetical protein U1E60_04390 [Reyranellaceae bacterium]